MRAMLTSFTFLMRKKALRKDSFSSFILNSSYIYILDLLEELVGTWLGGTAGGVITSELF
jgi:hypothetical protein